VQDSKIDFLETKNGTGNLIMVSEPLRAGESKSKKTFENLDFER
jgi:hypothetical protein